MINQDNIEHIAGLLLRIKRNDDYLSFKHYLVYLENAMKCEVKTCLLWPCPVTNRLILTRRGRVTYICINTMIMIIIQIQICRLFGFRPWSEAMLGPASLLRSDAIASWFIWKLHCHGLRRRSLGLLCVFIANPWYPWRVSVISFSLIEI